MIDISKGLYPAWVHGSAMEFQRTGKNRRTLHYSVQNKHPLREDIVRFTRNYLFASGMGSGMVVLHDDEFEQVFHVCRYTTGTTVEDARLEFVDPTEFHDEFDIEPDEFLSFIKVRETV